MGVLSNEKNRSKEGKLSGARRYISVPPGARPDRARAPGRQRR